MTVQQAFDLALQHHHAGRLAEAEALYRQILAAQPQHPDALHLLGVVAHQAGRDEFAEELIKQSIALNPQNFAAYSNLGEACRALGKFEDALHAYRHALGLNPQAILTHYNLGNVLSDLKRFDEAVAAYRRAIELQPDWAEAYNNLAIALKKGGQPDEAVAACRRALELRPAYAEAQNNLGIVLKDRGQLEEAIAAFRQALALQPDFPDAWNNLGTALDDLCQFDEAIAAYRQALALKADVPEVHNNLGNSLRNRGYLDEAVAAYLRALELKPASAEARANLGNALRDQGKLEEAIAAYRQALEANPAYAIAHSNLVYALHFRATEAAVAEEQVRWNQQFGKPLKRFVAPRANDPDPDRRLRIGYVSPDLRDHVVGRNVLPLFQHHDRREFEILCYAGVLRPDRLTAAIRQEVQEWRSTVGVTDEVLAEAIRRDRVDILVDLSQHMAGNRLPVFARQPAPVQVSFAGYPAGTGLEAIGYRISDRWLEAEAKAISDRERVFLIDSFWCYDPGGVGLEVNDLPAHESGRVTFGCLNNFCKVNEPMLRLWARVLQAVPEARLVMLSGWGSHRQRTLEFLAREGIEPRRVEFVELQPRQTYLKLYHRLDIVLDTFPYNGHTTSLDALWMGVPVVSLAGARAVSRAGLCQLSNLRLPELVSLSDDGFVDIATRLARDLPRLAELRRTLRSRLEASVLMDAPGFARNIEAAYRAIWRRWCGNG